MITIIICAGLLAAATVIAAALIMSAEAGRDQGWHFCAWCRTYHNERTGERRETVPDEFPLVEGMRSDGICGSCKESLRRAFTNEGNQTS